jgi:hypothetical protein
MTDHDRPWQRIDKATSGEAGGLHAAEKNGRYRAQAAV